MHDVIELVRVLIWPILVAACVWGFRDAIRSLIDRGSSIKLGPVSIEASVSRSGILTPAAVVPMTQILNIIDQAKHNVPPIEDLPKEQLEPDPKADQLPPELLQKGLLPFYDACVDRLEYTIGLPIGSLRRYVALRSRAFEPYLAEAQLTFPGYMDAGGQITAAGFLIDHPSMLGNLEILNATGSTLGALRAALGEDRQWRVVIGVVAAREDSVARIQAAQSAFAPAIQSGRLAIVELTWSNGMLHNLVHGVKNVIAEWESSAPR